MCAAAFRPDTMLAGPRRLPPASGRTQCASCGAVGVPKGTKGLRVREWECEPCGAVHDRDVSAARNILVSGQNSVLQ